MSPTSARTCGKSPPGIPAAAAQVSKPGRATTFCSTSISYPIRLPAGNDIGDTTPFEVEIRIAYGGRRLRAEKRLINQWSGASIEMRVDSEAR